MRSRPQHLIAVTDHRARAARRRRQHGRRARRPLGASGHRARVRPLRVDHRARCRPCRPFDGARAPTARRTGAGALDRDRAPASARIDERAPAAAGGACRVGGARRHERRRGSAAPALLILRYTGAIDERCPLSRALGDGAPLDDELALAGSRIPIVADAARAPGAWRRVDARECPRERGHFMHWSPMISRSDR